jgi:hypothetical protein
MKRLPLGFVRARGAVAIVLALMLACDFAGGRDLGQWGNTDPAMRAWYQSLMQPDVPTASCCGEADAYWYDEIHVREGRTFCTIDRGNPTGHWIVFVNPRRYVFCFVMGDGA